jgi:hypothetical protein
MQALDASSIAERVYALPQLIPHAIEAPIPESVVGLISQIIFGGNSKGVAAEESHCF